jgi:hypothetical protein
MHTHTHTHAHASRAAAGHQGRCGSQGVRRAAGALLARRHPASSAPGAGWLAAVLTPPPAPRPRPRPPCLLPRAHTTHPPTPGHAARPQHLHRARGRLRRTQRHCGCACCLPVALPRLRRHHTTMNTTTPTGTATHTSTHTWTHTHAHSAEAGAAAGAPGDAVARGAGLQQRPARGAGLLRDRQPLWAGPHPHTGVCVAGACVCACAWQGTVVTPHTRGPAHTHTHTHTPGRHTPQSCVQGIVSGLGRELSTGLSFIKGVIQVSVTCEMSGVWRWQCDCALGRLCVHVCVCVCACVCACVHVCMCVCMCTGVSTC